MAAATAMDVAPGHDRRLSISKSSSSKISKPSGLKKPSSSSSSSSTSASSSAAASRPIAKIVNADPSSFRRVVQELTGTTPPPTPPPPPRPAAAAPAVAHEATGAVAPPQPRPSSRLQQFAPPPLRPDPRSFQHPHDQLLLLQQQQPQPLQQLSPEHFLLQQQQHHHQQQQLLHHQQQLQHQHQQQLQHVHHHHHHHQQQLQQQQQQLRHPQQQQNPQPLPLPLMMLMRPPPNAFLRNSTSSTDNPAAFGGQFVPRLPMLSPHLLSPLPVLTPGDNTWANPLDVLPTLAASSSASSVGASNANPPAMNGDSNGGAEARSKGSVNPLAMVPAAPVQGQAPPPLPPPVHIPISPAARFQWPSALPWSPHFLSPLPPISPSFFPPSPGVGLGNFYSGAGPNGAMSFGSPRDFSFQGASDHGAFRPS